MNQDKGTEFSHLWLNAPGTQYMQPSQPTPQSDGLLLVLDLVFIVLSLQGVQFFFSFLWLVFIVFAPPDMHTLSIEFN